MSRSADDKAARFAEAREHARRQKAEDAPGSTISERGSVDRPTADRAAWGRWRLPAGLSEDELMNGYGGSMCSLVCMAAVIALSVSRVFGVWGS